MLRWYPSPLLRVVLELTFLPLFFMTVFAVMCVFDPDTPWGIGPLRGPGISRDFAYIALPLVAGWTAVVLGWRGAGRAFRWLIVAWHLAATAVLAMLLVSTGNLILHGEAIDLSVSLAVLGPLLSLCTLACAIVWIVGDARRGSPARAVAPLQRRNRIAMVLAAGSFLAAAVAFSLDYREVGALTCAVAVACCHEIMRPTNPSEELRRAFVQEGSTPP